VSSHVDIVLPSMSMIHLLILAVHLLATIAKLVHPGGVRAVVAESLLLKHQLVISSRARRRAPNLNSFDRFVFGLGSLPFINVVDFHVIVGSSSSIGNTRGTRSSRWGAGHQIVRLNRKLARPDRRVDSSGRRGLSPAVRRRRTRSGAYAYASAD
jgi:hypothetical protein